MNLNEFVRCAKRTRTVAWAREHNALAAFPAAFLAIALVLVGLFGGRGLFIAGGMMIFVALGVFGTLFDC